MEENVMPNEGLTADENLEDKDNRLDFTFVYVGADDVDVFKGVDDFSEYKLNFPVVVRRDGKYTLLAGKHLFQATPGQHEIKCLCLNLKDTSDSALAMEKLGLHTRPMCGRGSYAEYVLGFQQVKEMIINDPNTPVVEGWGGNRRGAEFESSENLNKTLSAKLTKSISSIRRYNSHGKNITSETLKKLAEDKAPRLFFEKIQEKKQSLLDRMNADQKPENEIVQAVSTEVLAWWNEFNAPKETKATSEEKSSAKKDAISSLPGKAVIDPETPEFTNNQGNKSQVAFPASSEKIKEMVNEGIPSANPIKSDVPAPPSFGKDEDDGQSGGFNNDFPTPWNQDIAEKEKNEGENLGKKLVDLGEKLIILGEKEPEDLFGQLQDIANELLDLSSSIRNVDKGSDSLFMGATQ